MEQRHSTGCTFAKIQLRLKPATEIDTLREELLIFSDWPFETVCSLWDTTSRSKHNSRLWFIVNAAAYNVTTYDISPRTGFRVWSIVGLLLRYEENLWCEMRKMLDTFRMRFQGFWNCYIF
jgi:hypothetical protein